MAFLRIADIITKVYDLLRQDVRTLQIDWVKHRRLIGLSQVFPAGNVYWEGPGPTVTPETMPGGDLGILRVVVETFFANHEGQEATEADVTVAVDAISDVLINTSRLGSAWDIGLDYAYPVRLSHALRLLPEAMPPHAHLTSLLDVEIRPT